MRKLTRALILFVVAVPVLILQTSCDRNMVFEEYRSPEGDCWNYKDLMKYNVNISETAIPYNFYINIRVRSDYKYSNLYLFMKTLYPSGKISVDTVECFLADVDGRWLGERSGGSIDNRILLRKDLRFQEAGLYSFEFEQAMRDTALMSIENFGIRIEKAEQ